MSPRIVIVGGVAGGMSAATRARRVDEQAEITVLEKSGYISFANCGLPYHVAGKIVDEDKLLLTTPELVAARFRIDARVHHEVTRIDRQAHRVEGIDHARNQPFSIAYDKLILAPGASPILPNLAGIDASNVFVLRNMEDTQRLVDFIDEEKPKRAVVVGAGFIGLEMVEAFRARELSVTLLEKARHVLPALDDEMSGWLEAELGRRGVALRLSVGLGALETVGGRVVAAITEAGERVECDLVLLAMGVRPNLELAKMAGITIGVSGGIATDEYRRTSDPDIYAVGDAAEVTHRVTAAQTRIPLAGAANRHGRAAGEHAATGRSAKSSSVLGTAVVRVFGLDAAVTGLSRRAAAHAGYDVDTAIVHPNDHASYYPGAQQMHLMVVYERSTRKVLGAQAVGPAGIDKRIDVVATLLHFGGTLDDLADLDLTYAPQFSSAKDPLHFAAFVAKNQLEGWSPGIDDAELGLHGGAHHLGPGDSIPGSHDPTAPQLLDVRTPSEVKRGTLAGAIHIPLDELRGRLSELDPNRPTVVFCHVGIRGHAAVRILLGNGFRDVRNLKGGWVQAIARTAVSKAALR